MKTQEEKRAYEREWRKRKYRDDPEYRKRKRATDNKWATENAQKIIKYKLDRGCDRCKYNKCSRALHFHHIDTTTKKFNVGEGKYRRGPKLWEEIEKCELLCANCHAEEEESRSGNSVGEC